MKKSGACALFGIALLLTACGQPAQRELEFEEAPIGDADDKGWEEPAPAVVDESPALRVTSFSPRTGSYEDIPSRVKVNFSTALLDQDSIEDPENWTWVCDNESLEVFTVELDGKSAYVDVDTAPAGAQKCILTASTQLKTQARRVLSKATSVTYRIKAATNSGSGTQPSPSPSPAAPTEDKTAPVARINSPLKGDRLAGLVRVQINAQDEGPNNEIKSGVREVRVLVNDKSAGTDTTSPYEVQVDTNQFTNGVYTIAVTTVDKAGNTSAKADIRQVMIYHANTSTTDSLNKTSYFLGLGKPGKDYKVQVDTDRNLWGFNLRSGALIDQIQPVWKKSYGPDNEPIVDMTQKYGGLGGGPGNSNCPDTGNYRVVGLEGYYRDGSVSGFAVLCRSQSLPEGVTKLNFSSIAATLASISQTVHGDFQGEKKGTRKSILCPLGTYAVGVQGRADHLVRDIKLICR